MLCHLRGRRAHPRTGARAVSAWTIPPRTALGARPGSAHGTLPWPAGPTHASSVDVPSIVGEGVGVSLYEFVMLWL